MHEQTLLNKIEHTLTASIRNFQMAEKLLNSTDLEKALGIELLHASINQIKEMKNEILKTRSTYEK